MAVFSVNQNRQLYVAKAYSANIDETSAVGTIGGVKTIGEGKDKELFFAYKGADGSMRSDRIQLNNLNYIKAFAAADMIEPLKVMKVSLDPEVNEGKPVVGQDYILRIIFRQWIGADERYQYVKDGAVHVTSAMNADVTKFYQAMVESLNFAFAREIGANKTSNPYLKFEAAASGITITEKEQSWSLGTESQQRVYFSVEPTTIFVDGADVIWGKVEDKTPAKADAVAGTTGIGNGKKIADLEYFCMGERGDQYRMVGWPNVINTTYLVDASKEYNALEIHHGFRDEGVNSYRSEKDITIVAESASVINSIISAINSAADLEVEPLG
jgi:hypothetical protein